MMKKILEADLASSSILLQEVEANRFQFESFPDLHLEQFLKVQVRQY